MSDLTAIPVLAQQWMDAWIAQDRAALEPFMAPDFALVGAAMTGRAVERATWLEVAMGTYVAQSCTFADPLVREISAGTPRVAAMYAVWTQVARNGAFDLSGRYWITDVWREGGPLGWQVALRSSAALDALAASTRAFAGH
ncbi:MAG TPA: nuclear transport factor 2 family protein [Croceibacterium sp.]|nr:nuclear transport factor 2 family protein [Croceibacterium sp.]